MFNFGLGRMGGTGGGPLSTIVTDSDGNQFTVTNLVYNVANIPFIVFADVADSDGNNFTIFN
jgi:hypothetical protein